MENSIETGKAQPLQAVQQEELEEFTERQMNDTRYTTRLAVDLFGTLYGGRENPRRQQKRRVILATRAGNGDVRRAWGLEAILREALAAANAESRGKPRTDHRHHAIDAIVMALTNEKTVQR